MLCSLLISLLLSSLNLLSSVKQFFLFFLLVLFLKIGSTFMFIFCSSVFLVRPNNPSYDLTENNEWKILTSSAFKKEKQKKKPEDVNVQHPFKIHKVGILKHIQRRSVLYYVDNVQHNYCYCWISAGIYWYWYKGHKMIFQTVHLARCKKKKECT